MQGTQSRRLVSRRMLIIVVSVIIISTALFVTGVVIERSGATAAATTSHHQETTQAPGTSGDPDGGHEGSPSGNTQAPPANVSPAGGTDERVFGLDLESPWFVGAFVLAWLVLITALVRLGRIAWFALLLAAILTAVLDIGEVIRKAGEANTTVTTIAVMVAAAHVVLAALALFVLARSARGRTISFG